MCRTFLLWFPAVVISKRDTSRQPCMVLTARLHQRIFWHCFLSILPGIQHAYVLIWIETMFLRSGSKSGVRRKGRFGMSNPDHLPIRLLRRRKNIVEVPFSFSKTWWKDVFQVNLMMDSTLFGSHLEAWRKDLLFSFRQVGERRI